MLIVKFYSINGDKALGQGYYMPSQKFFENEYIPKHHPQAKNIGNRKYQVDEYTYIKCVEENE